MDKNTLVIPRRDIAKFRSWLAMQPEADCLKQSFISFTEQEKVMKEMYKKWLVAEGKWVQGSLP